MQSRAGVGRCDFNLTLINASFSQEITAKHSAQPNIPFVHSTLDLPTKPNNGSVKNDTKRKTDSVSSSPPQNPVRTEQKGLARKVDIAVNWHKDSTLEDFSTIGVYHHTPESATDVWEIALKGNETVSANESYPALSVKLQDEDCYFMLGNFNHQHYHAVIAGKTLRYGSTHRWGFTLF